MTLDPTYSEEYVTKSIKKYLIDTLYTTDGIFIQFGVLDKSPVSVVGADITQWIVFHLNGVEVDGGAARYSVDCYVFTRKDIDAHLLFRLRDKLLDRLVDTTTSDGKKRIPIYNNSGIAVGGVVSSVLTEYSTELDQDRSLHKRITVVFDYGVK